MRFKDDFVTLDITDRVFVECERFPLSMYFPKHSVCEEFNVSKGGELKTLPKGFCEYLIEQTRIPIDISGIRHVLRKVEE